MKSDCGKSAKVGWTREYEKCWDEVFSKPCDVCPNSQGYFTDYDPILKKYIETTCLICMGTGYRKI